MDNKDFQYILKSFRIKHELTQKQLADKLFVSKNVVSKWERGDVMPDANTLKAIANLFDLQVTDILNLPEKYDKVTDSEDIAVEKRRLKYNVVSLVIDAASAALLIAMVTIALIAYNNLPEVIGVHFNGSGVIDGWAPKSNLFILIYVALGASLLILSVQFLKIRWSINIGLPVYLDAMVSYKTHRDNLYKGVSILISLLRLCLIQLFFFLNYYTAIQQPLDMGWFVFSIVILIVLPIAFVVFGIIAVLKMRTTERYSEIISGAKNGNK